MKLALNKKKRCMQVSSESDLITKQISTAKFFCANFRIYKTLVFLNCCKTPFRCLLVRHILRRKTWKSHASWRSPKHSRILENAYFPLWPVSKFGFFLSWMVAIVAITNKKPQKKNPGSRSSALYVGWGKNTRNAATLPDSDFYPPSIHCSSCPYSILP